MTDARWTDPEYAAEECARARRQADAARVEAREAREELARVTAEIADLRRDIESQDREAVSVAKRRYTAALAELAAVTADRDEARAEVAALREQRQAARFAALDGPHVSPRVVAVAEGRDPATRTRALPVVPARCGECEHEDVSGAWCNHPDGDYRYASLVPHSQTSPSWCPLRECAKAGA